MLPKLTKFDVRNKTELMLYILRALFAGAGIKLPDVRRPVNIADEGEWRLATGLEIKCFLDIMHCLKLVAEKEHIACSRCGRVICTLPDPSEYNFSDPDDRVKFSDIVRKFYYLLVDMVDLHGHIYCQKCQDMYINDLVDTLGLDSHFYTPRESGVVEVL
jgi:hypothetical protein